MIVEGTCELRAAPSALRAVLSDPRRLGGALPHVDDVEVAGDGGFAATIRPALALGEVPLRTRWQPVEAGGVRIAYAITGRGDEHWLRLGATVELRSGEGGGTTAVWSLDCRFSGTVRTVGQRVLPAIVAHQARGVLHAADALAHAAAGAPPGGAA